MAAHARDFFWKTRGTKKVDVGVVPRAKAWRRLRLSAQQLNHNPAPTSADPYPAILSVCPPPAPPHSIPSFSSQSVCSTCFRSRMQPKSATSLNHHNRLNSPDHTAYFRMCNIHVHMRVDEPEVSHVQDKHSLSLSKTRSSKSNTDAARPRIGLISPFIRGTTFPAIFPSTHHLALHCGTAYKLG